MDSFTPMQITETTVDPDFAEPFVEVDEERASPVPHRYVHGGFKGTDARFSFYFPPKAQYQGRFFHNTYPMAVSADIGPFPIAFEVATGDLGFTIDSGAYYVQTNNGATFRNPRADPAIAAYRVNAAAAKFSRQIAQEVYGYAHRPYGYLFGGSGGAYQTLGAAENTSGVWDGFVPFVPGCDHAIPSMFTARMHALRVLRRRNCLPAIADAMEPGGSGNPYAVLNAEEEAALREVTLMGFPLRGWYDHAAMGSGYFANISGMIPMMDPNYVEDFWSKPGYLGADPEAAIHADRFSFDTTLTAIEHGPPITVTVAGIPPRDAANAHLVITSGAAEGLSLPIASAEGQQLHLIAHLDPRAASLQPGDHVRIDNSWALALETYHRHQLPPETSYIGWNQFRAEDGTPLYPQRPVLVGPAGTVNSAGSMLNGAIQGKVLMLAALLDIDAYPWQGDWYRGQVARTLGPEFEQQFALWFIDNAHHENPMTPEQRGHAISYGGALQQALRDLSAWVEKGVRPKETVYHIADSQVIVPDRASTRGGVQPIITLTANGAVRTDVNAGTPVQLHATIEAPSGAGQVVSAEWDLDGSGEFAEAESFAPQDRIDLNRTVRFPRPGTYFVTLRAALQREGSPETPYARITNIARVRIVVS